MCVFSHILKQESHEWSLKKSFIFEELLYSMLSCSATNLIWQIETLTMRMPKKIKKKGVHHKNDLSGSCTYYCSMKYKAKIDIKIACFQLFNFMNLF